MIRALFIFNFICLFGTGVWAQQIQRYVVGNVGNTNSTGNVTVSWTIGETAIGAFANSLQLNQGFHQGETAEIVTNNCRTTDSLALVDLYNATAGWNWTNSWNFNQPINTWYGVILNANGCVQQIGLGGSGNNLTGTLPSSIGDFAEIEVLNLDNNNISGSIPSEFGNLTTLRQTTLVANNLTGAIPASMGNLTNLETCTLGQNTFSADPIPAALLSLPNLRLFWVDFSLIDSLPPFSPNANASINVPNNYLTFDDILNGTSQTLANFNATNQAKVYRENQIFNLNQGASLSIDLGFDQGVAHSTYQWFNRTTGEQIIDDNHVFQIDNIQPSHEGVWYVRVTNSFAPGVRLESYDITINVDEVVTNTCRSQDSLILVDLYNATNGNNWRRKWNLNQPMTTWEGVTLNSEGCVQIVFLNNNNLVGTIPNSIGNLSAIERLALAVNQISGTLPNEIGNLSTLTGLELGLNQLSGSIPNSLGNLSNIIRLYLGANNLTGTIPSSLGNLSNLQELYLSDNQLTGGIPTSFGNLSQLTQLYLYLNQLSGEIPPELGNLSNLQQLYLNDNDFEGCYPGELKINVCNLPYNPDYDGTFNHVGREVPFYNQSGYSFDNNPKLAWQGNFQLFCNGDDSVGATCDDGNPDTNNDIITGECLCQGSGCETTFGEIEAPLCPPDLTYELNGVTYTELGTYQQTLTNAEGCDSILTLTLVEGFQPNAEIIGDLLICDGTTTTLEGIGGSSYEWSNGATTKIITVGSGTYTVTVTNADGCQDISTATVTLDTEAPKITCPNNFSVQAVGNSAVVTWAEPTITDNCGSFTVNSTHQSGDAFSIGTTTVIYTVSDPAGNDNECSFQVTVTEDVTQTCRYQDSLVLVDLYNNANGIGWFNAWNLSDPIDTWDGITLNTPGCVMFIDLPGNNMGGNLPESLTQLDELLRFNVVGNNLGNNGSTSIPSFFGSFNKLQQLRLSSNNFSGELPPEIGNQTSLTFFEADNNRLTGGIPDSYGNLVNVTSLEFDSNQMNGTIPSSLGNMTALRFLYLFDNQLQGNLPASLANLSNLIVVEVQNNQLSGTIPAFTQDLIGLRLENNNFENLPDLSSINTWGSENWRGLQVEDNRLTFEDLIPNQSIFNDNPPSSYAPQDSVGEMTTYTVSTGENLTHDLGFDEAVTSNIYTWYKDGVIHQTITGNNDLTWNNIQLSDAGDYYVQVTNPNLPELTLFGRRVTLVVEQGCVNVTNNFTETICQGETYNFNGRVLTQAGNYNDVLQTPLGCDSTINLTLQVVESFDIQITEYVCEPQQDEVRTLNLTSQAGCDSIVTITTVYEPPMEVRLQQNTCIENQPNDTLRLLGARGCDSLVITSYLYRGSEETFVTATTCLATEAGTRRLTLTNQFGCDSIVNITTTLEEVIVTNFVDFTCLPNEVGVDTTFLIAQSGCDSLVVVETILDNPPPTETQVLVCSEMEQGRDTLNLMSQFGCDSIVYINRIYQPGDFPIVDNQVIRTCDPNEVGLDTISVSDNGQCEGIIIITTIEYDRTPPTFLQETVCNIEETGRDTLFLTNSNGCDSLVIQEKIYQQPPTTVQEIFDCNISTPEIDTLRLRTQFGCDSLVIQRTLPAVNSPVTRVTLTTCNQNEIGEVRNTFTNAAGCDSLVITTTTFGGSDNTFLTNETCDVSLAGTRDTTRLTNAVGCDSLVITLNIALPPSAPTFFEMLTCDPMESGRQDTVFLSNRFGCDSLLITQFVLGEVPITALTVTTCDPNLRGRDTVRISRPNACDSIVITSYLNNASPITLDTINSCTILDASTDTLFLQNQFGCDSIVVRYNPALRRPSPITLVNATTCIESEAGVDTLFLKNVAGCDSLVIRTTTFETIETTTITEIVCVASEQGTETLNLQAQNGCDSLVVIQKRYEPVNVARTASICEGQTYNFYGFNLTNAGTYENTITAACDTIVRLTLNVDTEIEEMIEGQFCEGEEYEFGALTIKQPGVYTQRFQSEGGCDSTVTIILEEVVGEYVAATNDTITMLSNQNSIEFNIMANDTFPDAYERTILETPALGTVDTMPGEQLMYRLSSGAGTGVDSFHYQICALDCVNNCDTATVVIEITLTCLDSLVNNIPTGFIPDGQNELDRLFDPLANISNECFEQPRNAELIIVNTWGEQVYRSKPYEPWNGRNNNDQPLPHGTYYYWLNFEINDESKEEIKGFVTLFEGG